MEDVNYIERWAIQRQEPKGIIKVRVEFADGTDYALAVSPGKVGTDIVEEPPGCWHCTAVVAAEGSTIFILGTYRFGPFSSVEFANRFGMRLMECVNDPNPAKYEAGWLTPLQQTYQDAAAYHRGVDAQPADEIAGLIADAHRYRRLRGGAAIDNERLINETIYGDICRNADKYAQLVDGNDVDGKRLLPVATIQRLVRMESTLGHVLGTITDGANVADLHNLGFDLWRVD